MGFLGFKSNRVRCCGKTDWGTRCKVKMDKIQMHSNDMEHFYCGLHFKINANSPGAMGDNPVWGYNCCRNHKTN